LGKAALAWANLSFLGFVENSLGYLGAVTTGMARESCARVRERLY